MPSHLDAEDVVAAMASADHRILRRLDLPDGPTELGEDTVEGFGVVIHVDTTGPDHDADVVIGLAARRFAYDRHHVVTRIDRPYIWREDPGRPLSDETARLTGLTDADLANRVIDEAEAVRIIASVAVRISHHARFARPFVERRLSQLGGLPWACSIEDVGWTRRGFESSRLGWILMQYGWFHDAHRPKADVDATIQILRHDLEPGRTALAVLMESASAPGWTVRAFGADFGVKDLLRNRGYRWDTKRRVWWQEVRDRPAEETWLRENVYAGRRCSAGFEPSDWTTRYACP